MSATVLYTPEVLGLATSLAAYPWDDALPFKGEARSKACGSTIALALSLGEEGTVERVALKSQACAIGQAAAAIFAAAAPGRSAAEIRAAAQAMEDWLAGTGTMPHWPGIEAIAAARDYPARHGAVLLPWRAARELLPSA